MIKRWLATLSLLCLIFFAAMAPTTTAVNVLSGADCSSGNNSDSAVCHIKPGDPLTGNAGLIINIANIVAYIAGAAAIILIVVSGIRFMTSGGDSAKVTAARQTLTGALIGIAVIVLARTLIVYVVKTLHP